MARLFRMPCGPVLALLLPLLLGAAAPGGPGPAKVERRGPLRIQALPGSTGTAVFHLTNESAVAARIAMRTVLPPGWKLLTPDDTIALAPRESDLRILGFAVPGNARAGDYRVLYSALAEDGTPAYSDSLLVSVQEQRRLELELLRAPRYVVAGAVYDAHFLLSNRGNGDVPTRLSLRSSPPFRAETDSLVLHLAPGELRTVPVRVSTEAASMPWTHHHLELIAQAEDDSTLAAAASVVVEMVARSGNAARRMHTLPTELRLRAGAPWGAATPIAVSGRGKLFEGSGTRVEFGLRPGTRDATLFPELDEYRLSLRGSDFELRLGDQPFGLSRLTERGIHGFGAGGSYRTERWSATAFTQRNRRLETGEAQHGAALGVRLGSRLDLGANILARTGSENATIGSIDGALALTGPDTLHVEVAAGSRGTGHVLRLHGARDRFTYSYQRVRTDAELPSRDRGISSDEASFAFRPAAGIDLRASMHAYERAAGGLLGLFGTQRSRQVTAGASFASVVSLELRHEESAQHGFGLGADRRSSSVRARLHGALGPARLHFAGEGGRTSERGSDEWTPFHRLEMGGSVRAGRLAQASASVDYFRGATAFITTPLDALGASAGLSVWPAEAWTAQVSARFNRYSGPAATLNTFIDAGLEHSLPRGHNLALRARLLAIAGATSLRRSTVFLEYTVPLGLPVRPSRAASQVTGHIRDAQSGEALPDVVVRVGDRLLATDAKGRFAFNDLTPGTHFLTLDAASAGLGRVASLRLPLETALEGGERAEIEIAMTDGAHVHGRVALADSTGALAAGTGFANALVELRREDEVQRRLTDAEGRFDFRDLRPGRWQLAVVQAELPLDHVLARETVTLDLAPGADEGVDFVVQHRPRPLRIIVDEVIGDAPVRP